MKDFLISKLQNENRRSLFVMGGIFTIIGLNSSLVYKLDPLLFAGVALVFLGLFAADRICKYHLWILGVVISVYLIYVIADIGKRIGLF